MLLYTIVPSEAIFDSESDNNEGQQEVEITLGQASLLAQSLPGGQFKISRIISTNPQDFLKPEWQPGNITNSF